MDGKVSSSAGVTFGGAAIISNTLAVSGAATLAGNVSSSAAALFGGIATFTNAVNVSGAATIVGKISSSAAAVLGPTIVSNTLAVSGAAELSGTVTLQSFISGNFAFPPYASFTKVPCVYLSGSTIIDPGYADAFAGGTPWNAGLFQFGVGKNTGSFTVNSNAMTLNQTNDLTHPNDTAWGLKVVGMNTVSTGPILRFEHTMSLAQMNTNAQIEHGRITGYGHSNLQDNNVVELGSFSLKGGLGASSSVGRYAAWDFVTIVSSSYVSILKVGQNTNFYSDLLTANPYGGVTRASGSISIGGDVLLEFDQTPGVTGRGNRGAHIVFAGNGNNAADAGDGFLHISGSSKGIALSGTVISIDSATNLLDGKVSSSAGVTFGGAAVISNTLAVSGAATLAGNVSSSAAALFGGIATFTNAVNVSGAATIVGKVSSSAAAIFGSTIISNALNVSGAALAATSLTVNPRKTAAVVSFEAHYTGSGNPVGDGAHGSGLSDDAMGGDVVYMGTGSLTAGKLYYLNTNGGWDLANAAGTGSIGSASAGNAGLLGFALGAEPNVNGMMIKGFIHAETAFVGDWVTGSAVYVNSASAPNGAAIGGAVSGAAPTTSDSYVRIVGYCTTVPNIMYFNPDSTWVENS